MLALRLLRAVRVSGERNVTSARSFASGRCLNDGIGAVGLRSASSMATEESSGAGGRKPMGVQVPPRALSHFALLQGLSELATLRKGWR